MQQPGPSLLPSSGVSEPVPSSADFCVVVVTGGGGSDREAGAPPLPCQSSNTCITNREKARARTLQPSHKKLADLLSKTVQEMGRKYGIERLGFLTLTFKDHVTDPKEAQRRQHSLRTNVLRKRYEAVVRVYERQMSGRIHYHFVVVLKDDIRTGFDFDAVRRKDYRSASPALRAEWAFWRKTAPRYRFGPRVELLPVRVNAEAISRYVGGYISKHVHIREVRDKGVRLVSITRGAKVGTTKFSWVNENARRWRRGVSVFAERHGITSYAQLSAVFGPRWAYHHRDSIFASGEAQVPGASVPPGLASSAESVARGEAMRAFKRSCAEGLATTAPPGDSRLEKQRECRQLVEDLRRELGMVPTANAAKQRAEVPPKPHSAEEPPEVPSAPRSAPRIYSLTPRASSGFLSKRLRHIEHRELKFTSTKTT